MEVVCAPWQCQWKHKREAAQDTEGEGEKQKQQTAIARCTASLLVLAAESWSLIRNMLYNTLQY